MPTRPHLLSAPYAAFMRNPVAAGPGVCRTCRTFVARRTQECATCRGLPPCLDAVVAVSYSVGGGRLHRELRGYKDDPCEAARDAFTGGLAAVLDRFLTVHERCAAAAAGVSSFALVTTVPSHTRRGDAARGRLREIVGRRCPQTASRYLRLLAPVEAARESDHRWRAGRFKAVRSLAGADVLLIDDTWTTGASAQSAAHALVQAGARRVALVVIGRHVNREHAHNARRLAELPPFAWESCAACSVAP